MEVNQTVLTGQHLAFLIARQIIFRKPCVAAKILGLDETKAPSERDPEGVQLYLEAHAGSLQAKVVQLFDDEARDTVIIERIQEICQAGCPEDVVNELGLTAIGLKAWATQGDTDFGPMASALAQTSSNLTAGVVERVITNSQELRDTFNGAEADEIAAGIIAQASLAMRLVDMQ